MGSALSRARGTKSASRRRTAGSQQASARLDAQKLKDFGTRLRSWYRRHARDLPWRKTRDPYAILVSELMLQQTQVSRVLDYWQRFLRRFPTIEHLARAREPQVLAQWQGLGYYARARNLHKLSRAVVREGATAWGDAPQAAKRARKPLPVAVAADGRPSLLPAEAEKLRKLPGVGAYTAGAVSSFAFERRAALVDTNVARVLARVFAPRLDPKRPRDLTVLWEIAEATLPKSGKATWTHNQALMELGALVCTARIRRCEACPVRKICLSATG